MHLHSADIPQAFLPPDLPVKLVCGKEGVGIPDEEGQDAVLHIGQMDVLAPAVHTAVVGIQPESRAGVAPKTGLGGIHLHPAHVGQADAGAGIVLHAVQALEYAEQLVGIGHVEAHAIVADADLGFARMLHGTDADVGRRTATCVLDGIGDQVTSAYRTNTYSVGGINEHETGYGTYVSPHRVVASAGYRLEYAKRFASSLSFILARENCASSCDLRDCNR